MGEPNTQKDIFFISRKAGMAVIAWDLIWILNPGQHNSTSSESTFNASLLVDASKQNDAARL